MKQLSILFVLVVPLFACSQVIKGKIYDEDSVVKGIQVINLNQNDTIYSDDKGNFKIYATVNDSIIFKSLFHTPKTVRVMADFFNNIMVFEVKKSVNELGEVLLTNEQKEKAFNLISYNIEMSLAIKEDMKRNPHLYMPKSAYSNGIDFVQLARMLHINKLFKKRPQKTTINYITYKQLDSLFSHSELFNDKLLTEILKIPKQHKYLFYEYCEAKKLDIDLLSPQNKLILMDSIFSIRHEFLEN